LFGVDPVKEGIHPRYVAATVTCGCGTTFTTRSTKPTIMVEICSKCHPFFTGKVKFVDTAGRVEKFQRKYDWEARRAAQREAAPAKEETAAKAK
jgi:large subunit ribosomal protein L31